LTPIVEASMMDTRDPIAVTGKEIAASDYLLILATSLSLRCMHRLNCNGLTVHFPLDCRLLASQFVQFRFVSRERVNLISDHECVFHACFTHVRVHSAGLLSLAIWRAPYIESLTTPVRVFSAEDLSDFAVESCGICICAAMSIVEQAKKVTDFAIAVLKFISSSPIDVALDS